MFLETIFPYPYKIDLICKIGIGHALGFLEHPALMGEGAGVNM
jgi:hypothetical protein